MKETKGPRMAPSLRHFLVILFVERGMVERLGVKAQKVLGSILNTVG